MELQVLQAKAIVHTLTWTSGSLTIGRAADNDLILRDGDVSGHHVLLFRESGEARCRDLGSTNGLFLNGERVVEHALHIGDVLTIGGLMLRVTQVNTEVVQSWLIRPADAPVAQHIVSGESIEAHPEAVLFVETDGVWYDDGNTPVRLTTDRPFTVDGDAYVLEASTQLAPTVPRDQVFPYRLKVDLHNNHAQLEHHGLQAVQFRAASRVSLLYVLANAVGEWVDDAVVGTGIWGREWSRQGANNLNVLIHRVRKQATTGGFDRRFLDRRRGALRLLVADAVAH